MNGDNKQIYDAIIDIGNRVTSLEATTQAHHTQNQKDLDGMGELNRSLIKHCNEIGKLKVHRAIHWAILGMIIVAVIFK